MTHLSSTVAGIAMLMAISQPAMAAEPAEPGKLLAVVQQFLDAMAQRDQARAYQVVLPEGRFSSVREEAGKTVIRAFSNQEDIGKWRERPEDVLERIWNPDVRVHGRMAVVTAPYDFHRDGKFSHCGVDVFELLETADGWRISGGVYTVQKESCPSSPLGLPKFERLPPAGR